VFLTERQEDILNNSIETSQVQHDWELQRELEAAHLAIEAGGDGAEDPSLRSQEEWRGRPEMTEVIMALHKTQKVNRRNKQALGIS
jgi:hypothetical protein